MGAHTNRKKIAFITGANRGIGLRSHANSAGEVWRS